MRRPGVVAATAAGSVATLAASVALVLALDGGFEVDRAEWLVVGGEPRLLVAGSRYESPESGPSYYDERWALLDLDDGSIVSRGSLRTSSDPGSSVIAGGGSRFLWVAEGGYRVREAATGVDADPSVGAPPARPWYQVVGGGPRTVAVEADDRRWWSWDLATDRWSEGKAPGYAPPTGRWRCSGLDWPQPDGSIWAFDFVETERHSDPNGMGLVRAAGRDYARLVDPAPLGLRVRYGQFLCDQRVGAVGDGDTALVLQWLGDEQVVAISPLDRDGKLGWTWSSGIATGPNLGVDLFGADDGWVVRVGDRVARIDRAGHERWRVDL
jgi:hypothetical protein